MKDIRSDVEKEELKLAQCHDSKQKLVAAGQQFGTANLVSKMQSRAMEEVAWPAPGLDDTQLGESSLPLELHRAQIPDRRVPSL